MSTPRRHRAANRQRVSSSTQDGWYWECDHAHDTTNGAVRWWDRELTQDDAYDALDEHNREQHPELTKGTTT